MGQDQPEIAHIDVPAGCYIRRSPDELRFVRRESVSTNSFSLILQRVQNDRAWSIVIAKDNGFMSVSVSAEDAGFVVFDACTAK